MFGFRAMLVVALVGSVIVTAGAQTPVTGAIRGRVEVLEPVAGPARRPTVSELGMPGPRQLPDRRRSVVYLETAPRGAFEERAAGRAAMDQQNESFVPRVLAIMTGTVVDFPNHDPIYHNVFSLSRTRPFDLGRYAKDRSKSVRFDRPGIVRVFCDIHSHMSAYILVFGHAYFALTDADGLYRIGRVPSGVYAVRVWNEASPGVARPVRVPEEGGEVELNFSFGREAGN